MAKHRSLAALAVGLALALPATPARALTYETIEAGSWIIPVDGCYARPSFMSDTNIKNVFGWTNAQFNARKCNPSSEKDDGLLAAYGMVFRLVRHGVPVKWNIGNPKSSVNSIDFTVSKVGGGAVRKAYFVNGNVTYEATNRFAALANVDYVGAPFVVAKADVPKAMEALAIFNAAGEFNDVDLHVTQVPFSAPVHRTLSGIPRLAILDMTTDWSQDKTNFILDYPAMAHFEPKGSWWDVVTMDEVLADRLTKDDFGIVWVPPAEVVPPLSSRQRDILDKLKGFAEGGGYVVMLDSFIETNEKYMPAQMTNGPGITGNGITAAWGSNSNTERTGADDFRDPLGQYGGITWTGLGGSKYNWRPVGGYKAGVHRPVYSDDTTQANGVKDGWDFCTWRFWDNDHEMGKLIYIGGFHFQDIKASGFRLLLHTLISDAIDTDFPEPPGPDPTSREIVRSSPILAAVDGITTIYQGTLVAENPVPVFSEYLGSTSDELFRFPAVVGHFRGIDASQVPDDGVEHDSLPPGAELFDAADGIPPVTASGCSSHFTAGCRTVFTNTMSGKTPSKVFVNTANVDSLKPFMGAALSDAAGKTLISRVLAGHKVSGAWVSRLGGIDRSTPAVIGRSPLVPLDRPTVAYVGGTDGMLHAICVEASGKCEKAGQELWAYIPRTQLPRLRMNSARVDGSPKVSDVYGDFGGGGPSWKTVLVFQTGSGLATTPGATGVYALDVTDPTKPEILWEVNNTNLGTLSMGTGLGVSMGPVRTANGLRFMVFVQTSNGGQGGAGFHVAALDARNGDLVWEHAQLYPEPRNPDNPSVPATALPAGATAFSSKSVGTIDMVLVPSLYGEVWLLDAATGVSKLGEKPLFRFSSDFNPIGAPVTVFRQGVGGTLRALVVSGGYVDDNVAWSPPDVHQYAVSFAVIPPGETELPIDEKSEGSKPARQFTLDLGAGNRGFAQTTVQGDELFIATDSADVNLSGYGLAGSSGQVRRFDTVTGEQVGETITTTGGAASIEVTGTTAYATGSTRIDRKDLDDFEGEGAATELIFPPTVLRRLWLRVR
jgi:hypothetical protein